MNGPASSSASLTHPGLVRDHNEDIFGISDDIGFWCVADGMGGHAGGDVASAIARDVILASIRAGEGVKTSILAAHDAIVRAADEGKGSSHMGSTVVALRSDGPGYLVAWVGDSRAYRWNGDLEQLSRDHSLVQSMIDSGKLMEGSPEANEIRNVITQCLGPPNNTAPQVDTVTGNWEAGDKILLCSDGLHGELNDDEISKIIRQNREQGDQAIIESLVDAALESGGADNITAVIISAPDEIPTGDKSSHSARQDGSAGLFRRIFVSGILVAAVLLLGYLLYRYLLGAPLL